ncbi:MAG: tRNA dihydrouridine synthase DusB [Treponemataceae bacterium]|nr:tRNA dihydrouridine synthase DusB [Treponemataceae bacterium]
MNELYHPVKIGCLNIPGNLFLAPVAGYSDRAFRQVCIQNGADMCYTEMVSAEALYRGSDKTKELLLKAPLEDFFCIQLFGGNKTAMFEGSRIVLQNYKPSLIDINCGCPVPKIIKSGAGSFLTQNPDVLYELVKETVRASQEFSPDPDNPVPVTVKIRSGWDSEHMTWKEAAQAAVDAGAQAVTIHSRTRKQGYEGKADWNILAQLVQLHPEIPVFGSGDVFSPEDAKRMLESTKCAGVMFARGAMGNPFIFGQTRDLLTKGSYNEVDIEKKIETGMNELKILIEDKGQDTACREMRKRFCCYTKGIQNGAQIRQEIVSANTWDDYKKIADMLLGSI